MFHNYSDATFLCSGVTYSLDYLSENGSCQPLGAYRWGFSFLLLFVFLVTLLIWSVGTYIFWLKAHLVLRAREIHEIPGEYKAVIELAAVMQKELAAEGIDSTALTNGQITNTIREVLRGGRIMHNKAVVQLSKYRFKEVFTRWFKRERWWLLGYIVSTVVWVSILAAFVTAISDAAAAADWFFFILFLVISTGVLLAMSIGRKIGSRVLIVLFFTIAGMAIGIASVPRLLP